MVDSRARSKAYSMIVLIAYPYGPSDHASQQRSDKKLFTEDQASPFQLDASVLRTDRQVISTG
jgi:hypothetical protein